MTYLRLAALIVVLLLLSLAGAWMYRMGGVHARADLAEYKAQAAKQLADAQAKARETEQRQAREIAAIAEQYERDKRAADDAQRKLVGDLRAGNVRLQKRWAGCVSDAAASAAELDAAARDREEGAAALVRAGAEADAVIRALQEILRKERQK